MITTGIVSLVVASFLASSVEMVEALTIVLALGVTRGWRSTNIGVVAALALLAVVVAILGPAVTRFPLPVLQIVVGTLLLIFGLQWLRKAVLRAGGFKALHDEDATYQKEIAAARAAGMEVRAGLDWYAFTLSFKGVFLEGLEVAFIVITFGSTATTDKAIGAMGIPLAAGGALAAITLVGLAGVLVHEPLSRVPENALKYAVGALLSTFGTFWGAEGVAAKVQPGVAAGPWPGEDLALLPILVFYLLCSFAMVALLRRRHALPMAAAAPSH